MDSIYTTEQGDTWDVISKKVYGTDKYAHIILDSNLSLTDTVFFYSGVEIIIPEDSTIQEAITDLNLPPWMR